MNYIAMILKKEEEDLRHILKETKKEVCERVQDEKNELNELSLDRGGGIECYTLSPAVACASDVAIEPAGMNAKPIYWERMSTGHILGPAQPEFLAKVGSGLQVSYWVVLTYQGEPSWINVDSLRSKWQFEAQASPRLLPATPIIQASAVTPKPDVIEQSALEFSDGM